MDTLFISLLMFFTGPNQQLNEAMFHGKRGNHELSESILRKISVNDVNRDLYLFYRLLNNFSENNVRQAKFYADQINDAALPQRYGVLTALMRSDLQFWADGDIADIARDMKRSTERLGNISLNKKTNDIQQGIVDKLTKLIKEAEDQAKNSGKGESQKGKEQRVQNPADQSEILPSEGKGDVTQAKLRKLQQSWNGLPPRERTLALQQITSGMTPRHRETIENYFRNLTREAK